MIKPVRFGLGAALAMLVTASLLVLMYTLIATNQEAPKEAEYTKIADIVMPERKIEVKVDTKVEKPEELDEPPPEVEPPVIDDVAVEVSGPKVEFKLQTQKAEISLEGPGLATQDGEYLPIVKVAPVYPRKAQKDGIEGYCTVSYTVTKAGRVRDVTATDCSPPGKFEAASIKAAKKFKYKPRIENGEAIEVYGVRNRFNYELEN